MTKSVTARPSSKRERLEDILVVDADVHVNDSPQELAPYCDMPWRRSLEHISSLPHRYLDIPGFAVGGGYTARFPSGKGNRRSVYEASQMRDELSELSIDIGVIFPDNLLKLALLPQIDYAASLARAYNAWLIDKWCTQEKGLVGCLVAAPQDPEDAAREIERYAKEPGIVGVYLPTASVDPLWGHRKYDPIYQAAQDADLPVILHSVTTVSAVFPCQLQQFDTELARHTISHTFSMMANLVSIVTTGVPVRFPNLRIAFTEAGVSWVPFIMNRLDKEYLGGRREVPFLKDRPSRYIKKMYFATQPIEEPENPQDLVTVISLYEGENITMFASDWPHHDFDHPREVFNAPFSDEVKRKIMGENALRFFKLDAQANRTNL